jgi:hypothetical protein
VRFPSEAYQSSRCARPRTTAVQRSTHAAYYGICSFPRWASIRSRPSHIGKSMESAQKPDKPWFLDAAFVIPLSIFIGYFCALSEVMGEYTYFNIPYSFISLNPTTVLARSRLSLALRGCTKTPAKAAIDLGGTCSHILYAQFWGG